MKLTTELSKLEEWTNHLPKIGMEILGNNGSPMYVLDLIMVGAIKRSLSLANGVLSLVATKNMTCVRALVRMQLDTVSRLFAYTYVSSPSDVAKKVIGGKALNKFKSRDGKILSDRYLIDKLSKDYPWVKNVYQYTSGYIHFSERQVFDSIHSIPDETERTVLFQIRKEDDQFPEESWVEVVECFNEMLSILGELLLTYRKELNQVKV